VYNGTISAVKSSARGILPTCEGPQQYHTILFTDNPDIVRKEKRTIIRLAFFVCFIYIFFFYIFWGILLLFSYMFMNFQVVISTDLNLMAKQMLIWR
jgi:hypothetical protein